ncbi:NAD(P)-binding domain-containing protein [Ensifer adhaerens]|uniref:NAD(P)-binding domain-containing protein n=1 Tax=Ensifer adhaerens TaxID=106592 RepID=UPI0022AA4196|nr:NAD-binding protein [Ensifer adhaerens]
MRACSPADLAVSVDVLCQCLRNDADLHELCADRTIFRELGRDRIIINHATGDPIESEGFERPAAKWSVRFLDAPVSGGARVRKLALLPVSSTAELTHSRTAAPSWNAIAPAMGPAGSGQIARLCNNALTISNLRNVVEVFAMADKLGLSLAGLREAFAHSSGGSFILQALGTKVTMSNAAHIAELNRTDLREFAQAMSRKHVDPTALLQWGFRGQTA